VEHKEQHRTTRLKAIRIPQSVIRKRPHKRKGPPGGELE
jgi:hypothetical protein